MESIKCIIDNKGYTNKPVGAEIGTITKRMTLTEKSSYSIDEIKQYILDGRTIRPAYCGGKSYEWISQQMFMIDVDNGLTIDEAVNYHHLT